MGNIPSLTTFTYDTIAHNDKVNENFEILRQGHNAQESSLTDQSNKITAIEGNYNSVANNKMAKDLDLNGFKVKNLPTPTENGDGVPKSYADALFTVYSKYYTPYSVASGYTDANGYADFINKVSETEISFDVDDGTLYKPLVVAFPSGKIYTITSIANVTGIAANANYNVLIEEDNISGNTATATVTASAITDEIINGSGGSDGDYNLNYGVSPFYPEKKAAGVWGVKQFVKIGELTKTDGIIGTLISYAFNGRYVSQKTAIPAINTRTTFNCNIGSVNQRVSAYLECQTAELGYAIGDRVLYIGDSYGPGGYYATYSSLSISKNIITFIRNNKMFVYRKDTSAPALITAANWKLIIKSERDFK